MFIQQLNRSDPEKIHIIIENKEGAVLNVGEVVEWDLTNTLGLSVEELDANLSPLRAGVVSEFGAIADDGFGFIQIYGVHGAVLTSTTVTAGLVVAGTVETNVGKAINFASSTTSVSGTAANELGSKLGVALAVTDTNSATIMLACMG